MTAIQTFKLTKVFPGGITAVKDLTFQVKRGQIFGFLGPNGAGKTTTLRLLNGTLNPSGGSSTVLGSDSREEAVRSRTATLAEEARMYEHMSVIQNLRFFGRMYDLSADKAERRIRELLQRMGLWEKRTLKLGSFSTGLKKRVYLARTLLHHPEILFLDEPTSGLDPEAALQVTDLIRTLAREQEVSVFLCTHNLFLAERICDVFGFLREGMLQALGSADDLIQANFEDKKVEIRTLSSSSLHSFTSEEEIDGIIRGKQEAGEKIAEVRILRPSLEDVYFRTVGRKQDEPI
ncbi:MAG: ABC transporter ATP-binding protein [Spirochaetaceae bacterium]|nr:MAG: ABC transporter ATP-binding protein [Spirochaetaceae bacterium]